MTLHRTATAALAALAAAGCGASGATDKSGGEATPVTLRVGTSDLARYPGTDALVHLAREVRRRSNGALRISIAYAASGQNRPGFDQAVADTVRRGRLDLAAVPARAWDVEGVSTLRPLQAPFALQSDAQVARVLADRGLVADLLAGLRPAGVTGLVLLPDGLRHPFAFRGTIRSLDDFARATVRAPRSDATWALLRALGARPVDLDGPALSVAVKRGAVTAAESDFGIAASLPAGTTATGNVTFFPRVDALVANPRSLDRLSAGNRDVLLAAVAETAAWARRTALSQPEAARRYCRGGGRIVRASAAEVRALEAAGRPVTAALERDPATRTLLGRIHAVAGAPPAGSAVAPCEPGRGPAPAARPAPGRGATPIDGVYRNTITVKDLTAQGIEESVARQNSGIHTITLRNGHLTDFMRALPGSEQGPGCLGTYRLRGRTYVFAWDPASSCTGDFTATWSLDHRELRLTTIRTQEPLDGLIWGLKPFRRIR